MEQLTTRIGIEPGRGLVGRFGDTVILIPREAAAADGDDEAARELLGLAAEVASDRQRPASAIAARLARPSAQVVLLLGDGAAGFSLMDADTLVRWVTQRGSWEELRVQAAGDEPALSAARKLKVF